MDHTRLGDSGLRVSRLVLGCMGFGDPDTGVPSWALRLDQAREVVHAALDAGITVFDTANVYSLGASEEVVGQIVREAGVRDEVLLATKVFAPMGPGPAGSGLSRAAILHQAEQSLRRLGTDHIDLYQVHRFDPQTPAEETMEALHDLVKAGKVRYLGACSMAAWQFAKLQHVAERHGWTRFVSMQNQYNLLMREDEHEMHPLCLDLGVGSLPWSPLAGGRLARVAGEHTRRSELETAPEEHDAVRRASDDAVVDAVGAVAAERGWSRAQVALAWLLGKPAVTAPIVGATRAEQVRTAVSAVGSPLTEEEIAALEVPYTPRRPMAY